jgi:DNA-3-methyladenine glycosylase
LANDDQLTMRQLLARTEPIPRAFFERPADLLAPDLLGTVLVHGEKAGMLIETEAYLGLTDAAAHAARGLTKRTRVMFGPGGYAYVYLIYGMYECLNVVAEKEGIPHCVLVRALHPLVGLNRDSCSGPGKLTRAMGITREHYGMDLCTGPLCLRRWKKPLKFGIEVTPRIGIRHNADWLMRFTIAHAQSFLNSPLFAAEPDSGV